MKKREGRYLYITPSGWRKTIVHPEHVVRLEIVTDPKTGLRIPKSTINRSHPVSSGCIGICSGIRSEHEL
ncbi:MAG: hypothetical protein IPK92_14595 [Nitrospira sp.]|nr:hypothetical protein [Nitrospira sp.]